MTIKIALTKGRTEQNVVPILKQAGIDVSGLQNKQRRLVFNEDARYEFILVKGADVLTYLNSGAVQVGIVGSDILEEQGHQQYEMMDLRVSRCRFALASTTNFDPNQLKRKIIATKYPKITQRYFEQIGEDVEIVKIEGSVELAPIVGMSDAIVDIVQTGRTLKENNLKIYANLQPVSTKLVVNRLALKQYKTEIKTLIKSIASSQIKLGV